MMFMRRGYSGMGSLWTRQCDDMLKTGLVDDGSKKFWRVRVVV